VSVTEADVMTLMGETQEATVGGRQAEISAAIDRQAQYEAGQRAAFGTAQNLGPQFLAQAVPLVTGAAFGMVSSFGLGGGSPHQLAWQDPQVNFPRGISNPRVYVPGTEPPPPNRLPVPYEPPPQPGPFAFGIGGVGAILGGIIAGMWEGWPNALGQETGPFPDRAPSASPRDETPEEGPAPGPADVQGPPQGARGDNPPFPDFPDFGGGPDQEPLPEDIALGPVPDMGPPQGARQPVPTPAPTQRTLPPWVWPVIGSIGAISLSRAGRSRSSMTLPVNPIVDLTVLNEPLLSSAQLAGPGLGPMTLTGSAWDQSFSDDGCNCGPKKRGKKRKCLARAQLTWRSGPKKGKAAGSRCYRWANE